MMVSFIKKWICTKGRINGAFGNCGNRNLTEFSFSGQMLHASIICNLSFWNISLCANLPHAFLMFVHYSFRFCLNCFPKFMVFFGTPFACFQFEISISKKNALFRAFSVWFSQVDFLHPWVLFSTYSLQMCAKVSVAFLLKIGIFCISDVFLNECTFWCSIKDFQQCKTHCQRGKWLWEWLWSVFILGVKGMTFCFCSC